ncbi:ester cyclase [Streptomyces sp. NPDC002588]|uniref:ester cyclase n=1 Tax=Streptomyces sp. NPDC002588 TaxID=3154419 RepID=UPI0033181FF8
MSDIVEVVDRNIQAWRSKDFDSYFGCYREDAAIVAPGGVRAQGREGIGRFMSLWENAAPDNSIEFLDRYSVGSVVVHEGVFRGTHTGDLLSWDGQALPATGRTFELTYCEVFVVVDGLITEQRLYFDQMQLLTQLGVAPGGETTAP